MLFYIIFIFSALDILGQSDSLRKRNALQDSIEDSIDKHSQIDIHTAYMSRVVYAGRDYGINQYGVLPGISYKNKNGVSIYDESFIWSGMQRKYFKNELGMSWEHEWFDDFSTDAGYERWFINDSSADVRNSLTNALHLGLMYFTRYLHLSSYNMYMYGTNHAFVSSVTAAGNFAIRTGRNGKLYIQPFARYIGGNSITPISIYQAGYAKTGGAAESPSSISFATLDYELGMQLFFKYKKIEITPQYIYAFPVNPSSENPQTPFGYFTIDVVFKILFKKNKY